MLGNLEPDEDVMNDELIAKRKSAAVMKALHDKIKDTIAELGWDCYDNVAVEIGGTSVYEIDGGDNYDNPYGMWWMGASDVLMNDMVEMQWQN